MQYFSPLFVVSYSNQREYMKTLLRMIAVIITASLLFVSVTNIIAAPVWMTLMVIISTTTLLVIVIDAIEELKKAKA